MKVKHPVTHSNPCTRGPTIFIPIRDWSIKEHMKQKILLVEMIGTVNDKKLYEKFVDISFGFQVVHHSVRLADDVTLFVKGYENIPR